MSTSDGLSSPDRKKIMDKNLDKSTQSRSQVAPTLPASERPGLSFPPTRAARSSRGRGVFLGDADQPKGRRRPRWVEVPVAIVALAVAAFALTVCFNAPSIVSSGAFGPNPGPAMVAAASVAPPFVLPAKLR
jgi:hypothetical protein